ncbi:MerR family transcriptional regulator [Allosalinactinospora lopnorensis]|uniref:MerR family transcriptional regulator n=1 Tax=Allosalinactinospora lopnorensis TaxID=1352348 RepID=UPI000623C7CB|nr:MerR family transcriptional regulator [Allosalinactinospora lopnorensis]
MQTGQVAETYTVAQVAARAGVGPDTVRYYERTGLLPAPARTSGDHRRYGEAAVERLRFIRGTQRLGLRLAEIRELLVLRDTGVCPCEPAEGLLRRRIAEIDTEVERLSALRAELVTTLEQLGPDCPAPISETWCPPDRADTGGR